MLTSVTVAPAARVTAPFTVRTDPTLARSPTSIEPFTVEALLTVSPAAMLIEPLTLLYSDDSATWDIASATTARAN